MITIFGIENFLQYRLTWHLILYSHENIIILPNTTQNMKEFWTTEVEAYIIYIVLGLSTIPVVHKQ